MKNDFIIKHYRDEKILMLFSYLETLPENSRFINRLMYASTTSFVQLKHHGIKHNDIISILRFGVLQLEDPQEVMFTQQVGSPYGSFTVFPGSFMFYQDNLTRLLNIAGVCGISKNYLSIVYFFLHLSQLIAERSNLKRYDGGEPESQEVFIPDKIRVEKEMLSVFIQKTLMDDICQQYGISGEILNELLCRASRKELREDLKYQGYSDMVTLSPFIKYQGGYIILHPSALLHCAYYFCKVLLINKLGKNRLYEIMNESIINEVGCILKSDRASSVIGRGKIHNSIDYLLYSIDAIHTISIIPIVAERNNDLSKISKLLEQFVTTQYKDKSDILHIVVYTQLDDGTFGLMLPQDNNALALSIDDLAVVMNHPKMTLKSLYYYKEDKKNFMVPPRNQEMDLLTYYIDADFTFYTEKKSDLIFVEIGTALHIRIDYYTKNDIRYVYYPLLKDVVPVHHFADIPKDIPLYVPLYAPKTINFLMVELGKSHLFFIPDDTVKNARLFYEICHSFALWLYAVYYRKHVNAIDRDLCSIIRFDKNIIKETGSDRVFTYGVALDSLKASEHTDMEEFLLQRFVASFQQLRLISTDVSYELLHSLFAESNGHFLLLGETNPILINDGITVCYFVNERWADEILDEIAHYIDYEGEEVKLSMEESQKLMQTVMSFLQNEEDKLLEGFNSKIMLEMVLKLHHSMIYWSRLSQARFKQMQLAYRYLNSDFTGQEEYLNQYAEMNVLSQGIIEHIVLNDMKIKNGYKHFDVIKLDRLFAILHHISNMGVYFDSLNMNIPNTELTLLSNGRLAIPWENIAHENKYFSVLRSRAMNNPEIVRKQSNLLQKFDVDYKDKEFVDAFKIEYGIYFDIYCDIIRKSIEYSNKNRIPVIEMKKANFVSEILSNFTEEQVNSFFIHFVLSSNINKDILRFQDKLLQRYNRETQITTRPWILYDGNILFSTKALYNSFAILTEKISNGTLRCTTKEMKNYLGKINDQKGNQFTKSLKDLYESLKDDNLHIWSEVLIQPNKTLSADKNYGDIDLLIINNKLKKIVCVEAKDYFEARTAYDLLDQDRKIVKALPKVENRDKWCKVHKSLFKNYSPKVDGSYSVRTWYVTYNEPAYRYVTHINTSPICMLSSFEIVKNPYCIFD